MGIEEILLKTKEIATIAGNALSPYTDTLSHRFLFALVLLGVFFVFRRICYFTGSLLSVDFEEFHLRKHVHWYIFCTLVGCVLIAGHYQDADTSVYTIFCLLRNIAPKEWLEACIMLFFILIITSLFRSLQYLLYVGFWASLRVWADKLFFIACGMVLGVVLEFIGVKILDMQVQILIALYLIGQMLAVAGAGLWMIGWFALSFFTEESIANFSRAAEQQQAAKRRTQHRSESSANSTGSAFHSTLSMPGTIRDAFGNIYHDQSYGEGSRTYYCRETGSKVVISDSDISMSGSSAHVGHKQFYW